MIPWVRKFYVNQEIFGCVEKKPLKTENQEDTTVASHKGYKY
jgi:hypothetical protein